MRLLKGLAFAGLLTGAACGNPDKQSENLKLWYDEPAEKWTDALPLGNGRVGAMVFGGVDQDRIQFNEETLWTGGPRDYSREGAVDYLPVIRKLLFEGNQAEAEELAGREFMGKRSHENVYSDLKNQWIEKVTSSGYTEPANPDYADEDWQEIGLPMDDGWEKAGLEGLDGSVWFRTTFSAPASWQGSDLVLQLGRIRDNDRTFINGQFIGSMQGRGNSREYEIAADLIKQGENVIAVQVLNFDNKGGFDGLRRDGEMAVFPKGSEERQISLQKPWKYFIQDENPPPFPQYMAAYQPFGDLWLEFQDRGEAENYRRELDIETAVSKVIYEMNGVEFTREYFVSHPDQALVVHLTASKPGSINFDAVLNSPHSISSTESSGGNMLELNVQVKNGALKGISLLRAVAEDGSVETSGDRLKIRDANAATLFLTAATNYVSYDDVSGDPAVLCQSYMARTSGIAYGQVKEEHVREYQEYFNAFSITFPGDSAQLPTDQRIEQFSGSGDHALMALYVQYGRYLLISSSRPGTRPANLQGIWNDLLTPPWGSKYTCNINVEMNYWPAELLNLSPCHEPLFDMIDELAERGKETAKEHYGSPGWVLHHNTDLWRGTAPVNASNHGIWVTGGGWLSHHLWERYLFTRDIGFLEKRAYPVIKEAALFFDHFLIRDPETNWLISSPSNSPETGGLVAGPAMDHQIIRSLFRIAIEAGELLNVDEDFRNKLAEKLPQIAPDQIGKHGQLQEWLQDIDDPDNKHRHVSHLWGVHPGTEITWDQPELMEAARQSLIFRGDEGTGWSLAWKINFWSRFKDGDHAYELIKTLLSPAENPNRDERGGSYRNLFDAHPPFQIDGNFGGAAGIVEMLMQSHNGLIELLPALPSVLKEGQIKGVCARGGFELDFNWEEGKLQQVKVTSNAGETCILKYGNKEISFDTEKGETYTVNADLELVN